jgi:hypothetical protein
MRQPRSAGNFLHHKQIVTYFLQGELCDLVETQNLLPRSLAMAPIEGICLINLQPAVSCRITNDLDLYIKFWLRNESDHAWRIDILIKSL